MRSYLAGIGTSGILLLAALAVFVVASALVAFNGWPDDDTASSSMPVVVFDPGRADLGDSGPAGVAAAAAADADEVAFAAPLPEPAGVDAALDGRRPAGDDPRRAPAPGTPAPGDGGPETPVEPSPPSGGQPGTSIPVSGVLPGGGPSLTRGLADGVESLTDFLGGETVGPLSPELGRVVTGTGQVVTDVVRALDGAAAVQR